MPRVNVDTDTKHLPFFSIQKRKEGSLADEYCQSNFAYHG